MTSARAASGSHLLPATHAHTHAYILNVRARGNLRVFKLKEVLSYAFNPVSANVESKIWVHQLSY